MRRFSTPVDLPQASFKIEYSSGLVFMGSCFAETMGQRMKDYKFQVCHNPFGVTYNPLSIANSLELLAEKLSFTESDLKFQNGLWFSFNHYTLFSHPDKEQCLQNINHRFNEAVKAIRKADVLVLTLGTSWFFRLKQTGEVVNNCHKLPAKEFTREFSTLEESTQRLKGAIGKLRAINPKLKIIVSVSPIRHWKDGAVENQRSKAALILTASNLERELDEIFYFPAYEIVMDELRDYRFYAPDMVHPSEVTEEYIWEKFRDKYVSEEAQATLKEVKNLLAAVEHKPRFRGTEAYRKFVQSTLQKVDAIQAKYPFLDFSAELNNMRKL